MYLALGYKQLGNWGHEKANGMWVKVWEDHLQKRATWLKGERRRNDTEEEVRGGEATINIAFCGQF